MRYFSLAYLLVLLLDLAWANPTGGSVAAGSASINTVPGTVTVNQSSNSAIINWQSFSISTGELTKFVQPSAASATLNRVLGGGTSFINGTLSANGQIFLVNQNGVVIGAGGLINAASFIASTRDITDTDFLKGNLHFTGQSAAGIKNLGTINALGGDVVLIGKTVENQGTINATGTAGLVAGDDVLLAQQNSDGSTITVNPSSTASSDSHRIAVSNSGLINATSAELKAANGNLYALAIQNSGTIRATTVSHAGGHIWLTSDKGAIVNSGTLDASATAAGAAGGAVKIKAGSLLTTTKTSQILATGGAGAMGGKIETSGDTVKLDGAINAGSGGTWLIDPVDLTIDATLAPLIDQALNNSMFVYISTDGNGNYSYTGVNVGSGEINSNGSGDIIVATAINSTGAGLLSLSAYRNIDVNANISVGGANVTLTADNSGTGTGTVAFSPGTKVTTTGVVSIYYNPINSTAAVAGTVNPYQYLTPTDYTGNVSGASSLNAYMLVNNVYDLQNVQNNLTGTYALSHNIDASTTAGKNSGAGFNPIGSSNAFSGTFNGQSFTINGLTINLPNGTGVGLFAASQGLVENVGLIGGSVTGASYVGGLIGYNTGTITNSYATGAVNAGNLSSFIGGLVGYNNGTIANSYATGAVSAGISSSEIGGLVGYNSGTITGASYSSSNVTAGSYVGGLVGDNGGSIASGVYASGSVTGGLAVGGLIGYNTVSLSGVSASGNVTGSSYVGGLVGNMVSGDIQNSSYTTGSVSGITQVGGLVGFKEAGTISNSQASGAVSGSQVVGGLVGANYGNISGSSATGSVTGTGDSAGEIGGLVGYNYTATSSTISNSFASGAVTASGANTFDVGGLVGANSYGTITGSYATGAVTGTGSSYVGGLVGINNGTLTSSYATGTVTGTDSVGGLVGYNGSGAITSSYAAGAVSGQTSVGGLVGQSNAGSIANSYYSTTGTGQSVGVGNAATSGTTITGGTSGDVTGLTTGQFADPTQVAGLSSSATPFGGGDVFGLNGVTNTGAAINGGLPYFQWQHPVDYIVATTAGNTAVFNGTSTHQITGAATVTGTSTAATTYTPAKDGAPGFTEVGSNVDAGTSNEVLTTLGSLKLGANGLNVAAGHSVQLQAAPVTITPAPVTLTVTTPTTVAYGTTPTALTGQFNYTATGLVTGTDSALLNVDGGKINYGLALANGQPVTTSSSGNDNVGTYVGVISSLIGLNPNYTVTTANSTPFSITPISLTTAVTAANKTFDGTLTATVTSSGLTTPVVYGDNVTLNLASATAAFASIHALTSPQTVTVTGAQLSGADAGNYTLGTAPLTTTATISPLALTITPTAGQTKVYGNNDPNFNYSLGTALPTSLTAQFTGTLGRQAGENVGNYAYQLNTLNIALGAGAQAVNPGDYTVQLSPSAPGFAITPAQLTYQATPTSFQQGTRVPPLTGTVTGLVYGLVDGVQINDTQASVFGRQTPTFTTTATPASAPGSYASTGGGLTPISANYVTTLNQAASNATAVTVTSINQSQSSQPNTTSASQVNNLTLDNTLLSNFTAQNAHQPAPQTPGSLPPASTDGTPTIGAAGGNNPVDFDPNSKTNALVRPGGIVTMSGSQVNGGAPPAVVLQMNQMLSKEDFLYNIVINH